MEDLSIMLFLDQTFTTYCYVRFPSRISASERESYPSFRTTRVSWSGALTTVATAVKFSLVPTVHIQL